MRTTTQIQKSLLQYCHQQPHHQSMSTPNCFAPSPLHLLLLRRYLRSRQRAALSLLLPQSPEKGREDLPLPLYTVETVSQLSSSLCHHQLHPSPKSFRVTSASPMLPNESLAKPLLMQLSTLKSAGLRCWPMSTIQAS